MPDTALRSVYVHVPFCASKCGYCAFYSIPGAGDDLKRRYLARLAEEATAVAPCCGPLDTLYVGGGTPSSLSDRELAELLSCLLSALDLATGAEFSIECNPGSLTPSKVDLLVRSRVNRVSLGIQSFDPALRATLGRAGSVRGLSRLVARVRTSGIANIGADLIYAIPGQSVSGWRSDLRRACDLGICHLSTYELTAEEGARLAADGVLPADEEQALEMWHAAEEVAGEFGLVRYEVSNLARPGRECRHNDAVWHGAGYVGLGPAASSYDGTARRTNPADLHRWLEGTQPDVDALPAERRAAEVLSFGLRTVRGWTVEEYHARTGFDYMALRGGALRDLAEEGLLAVSAEGIRPTERGLVLADYVARALL